ncbi:hypothetical protein BUALT_Bualt18G0016900 [Buddleja alternifolia]|uniref:Uncharacterized protein n=1 Tax=Buddleja alternifolia TaxID=168488 RepID=A0AAV6W7H5_9LAMI|nr:hypothetical protein BUALT_Bualt18G0016900 [Buddleja alternifolia]
MCINCPFLQKINDSSHLYYMVLTWFMGRLDISSMSNMHSPSNLSLYFSITIIILVLFYHCDGRDSISVRNPLSGIDQTLVSAGNRFELGFFTTEKSNTNSNRYIGIWYYKLIPRTIVWVANRDKPLSDSCSVFGVADDGNLQVWCRNGTVILIKTALDKSFNATLQLLDSGNLKLFEGLKGHVLWESFDNPTDTFLPGMKMNDNMKLTSWIDQNDPGTAGNYTFKRDQGVYSINKRSIVHWKSRESGIMSSIFNELPYGVEQILSDFDTSSDQSSYQSLVFRKSNGSISFPNITRTSYYNKTIRILMNSSGEIQYYLLDRGGSSWSLLWSEPSQDSCSVYNACGKFAVCHIKNTVSMCQCLPGFKSASYLEDWRVGPGSDNGCERESIICPNNATPKPHDDNFVNISLVKVGGQVDAFDQAQKEEDCKEECLNNCECEAYSFIKVNVTDRQTGSIASKCWIWTSEFKNLEQEASKGFQLSLRVPFLPKASAPAIENSEQPNNNSRKRYVILFAVLVAGIILVFGSSYIFYRRRRNVNGTGNHEENPVFFSYESERQVNDLMDDNDKKVAICLRNMHWMGSSQPNLTYSALELSCLR